MKRQKTVAEKSRWLGYYMQGDRDAFCSLYHSIRGGDEDVRPQTSVGAGCFLLPTTSIQETRGRFDVPTNERGGQSFALRHFINNPYSVEKYLEF